VAQRLITDRLVLRAWQTDDAEAALGAYGDAEVARWLTRR
jgi:RimJ/RimL family protein N-acetyltransferase